MKKDASSFSTGSQGQRKRALSGGRHQKSKRVYLEALESRQLLSVTLTFGGAGTALGLAESSAGASNVKISEPSANVLRIDLNGGNFNGASTAAGGLLTYNNGTPAASTFADINITGTNAITTLNAALTGDLVTIGTINNANGGVGNLSISGNLIQVLGASTVSTSAATAGAGNIVITSETSLKVQTGATLQTKDGSIILKGNLAGNTGNFDGIDVTGAAIETTGTGSIVLQGNGSSDSSTANHIGVKISSGAGTAATVTATGSGNLTITGNGGVGTSGNIGVDIAGANISAVAGISISGTGGHGTDGDVGVNIDGLSSTQVTTPGLLKIAGTGGGTGGATNEVGVAVADGALVLATGDGSIAIFAAAGTTNSTALNITTSSNVLASNGTLSMSADSMLLAPTPTISASTVLIQPLTAGTQIDVGGSSSAGVLGLSTLGVDGILAGTLQIGSATAGAMVVSGTINAPSLLAMKLVSGGAITETGSITTSALAVQSGASAILGGANSIHVLAASVTGALTFNNAAVLTIGTADGLSGVNAGGNLTLAVAGALTVGSGAGESISTSGLADLSSAGISEASGSIITAANLELRGTGSFVLPHANVVGTLAANVTGLVQFVDAGALVVGVAGASAGIQSGGANVSLTSGGNLTVAVPVQVGSATVTLGAVGAINGPGVLSGILAGNLAVTGGTNLGTAGTPFATTVTNFAATVSGGVFINNTGALVIGTVGSLNGVTAASDVSINTSGTLAVNQSITTAGNVVVSGAGTIAVGTAINGLSAVVQGSAAADSITISTTGTAPMSVDGRGGTDTYTIDFGGLQSNVNVAPSSGTNTIIANGTATANTFGIATGIIVWNGSEFVSFSDVLQVFLEGGAGNDVFIISPTTTTSISAGGGSPDGTTAGDGLHLSFAGATVVNSTDTVSSTGHGGSFTFSNRQAVNYAGMEIVPTLNVASGSALAITVVEGKSTGTVALASFADPEGAMPASAYSATVNWGDGSTQNLSTITFDSTTQAFTLQGSHVYAGPGVYHPTIVFRSSTGLSSNAITETVTVSAIPIVMATKPFSGTEGKGVSATVATFTTTRTAAVVADYTASINWGDGTTSKGTVVKDSAGHFHVTGSHTYSDQSTGIGYRVTTTVSRNGANDTRIGTNVKMAGVPISSPTSKSSTAHVNVLTAFVLGTFKDQNAVNTSASVYTGTVTWGDGTSASATFVRLSTSSSGSIWQVRASHKFTSKKAFKPVVKIHDVANPSQVLTINDTITVS